MRITQLVIAFTVSFPIALSATTCVQVGLGEPKPCAVISTASVFFVGTVTAIRDTGKLWPTGVLPSTPMYEAHYTVVEAFVGAKEGDSVTVLQPYPPAVGKDGFAEAYRRSDGIRPSECGDLGTALPIYLGNSKREKDTFGTTISVYVAAGATTNDPIRATVSIRGPRRRTVRTDPRGYVQFENLPPGRYRIHVTQPDFSQSETASLEVLPHACTGAVVRLKSNNEGPHE